MLNIYLQHAQMYLQGNHQPTRVLSVFSVGEIEAKILTNTSGHLLAPILFRFDVIYIVYFGSWPKVPDM
jgi:hypothetical protein